MKTVAGQFIKPSQEVFCLRRESFGSLYHKCHIMVSAHIAPVECRNSFALKAYFGLRLRSGFHFINDLAVYGINDHISSESRNRV